MPDPLKEPGQPGFFVGVCRLGRFAAEPKGAGGRAGLGAKLGMASPGRPWSIIDLYQSQQFRNRWGWGTSENAHAHRLSMPSLSTLACLELRPKLVLRRDRKITHNRRGEFDDHSSHLRETSATVAPLDDPRCPLLLEHSTPPARDEMGVGGLRLFRPIRVGIRTACFHQGIHGWDVGNPARNVWSMSAVLGLADQEYRPRVNTYSDRSITSNPAKEKPHVYQVPL